MMVRSIRFLLTHLQHLGAFGGRSPYEELRRMMDEVIGHDLALQYNLSGKGAARSLQNAAR